jgi:hypothetical protein
VIAALATGLFACGDGGASSGSTTSSSGGTGGTAGSGTSSGGGTAGSGGGTAGGATGGGGGTPDPAGACEAYCAQVSACSLDEPACSADCAVEASYDSQLGDTCSFAFQAVLECAAALPCDALAEHVTSGGATGACAASQAAYAGLAECAPPVVCDSACAVLLSCDPALTSAGCRFGCAVHILAGQGTVSGLCGDLQVAYFECVSGATCAALADGSACSAEKDAVADCL